MSLPVVVCIGSSSVSGDALGPMVGDLLREVYNLPAFVYGGFSRPVNGVNYREYAEFIAGRHAGNFIIAVDACVGAPEDVGRIKFSGSGLKAGGALNKELGKIGDIGILGVVAARSEDNLEALMGAPFRLVEKLSEAIARKISALVIGNDPELLHFSSENFSVKRFAACRKSPSNYFTSFNSL